MAKSAKKAAGSPVAYAIYAICGGKSVLIEVKRIPDEDATEEWKSDDGGYGDYWSGNEALYLQTSDVVRDARRYRWLRECPRGSEQAYVCLSYEREEMDEACDEGLKDSLVVA